MTNDQNELLRSAYSIAMREGCDTNWDAFQKVLREELVRQRGVPHSVALTDKTVIAATCTAKTFRLPIANRVTVDGVSVSASTLWNNAIKTLYGTLLPGTLAKVMRVYGSPASRAYHTIEHVLYCLTTYCEYITNTTGVGAHTVGLSQKQAMMILAIYLHDAVYDPEKTDNEEMSKLYAEVLFKHSAPSSIITYVNEIIDATKHNMLTKDMFYEQQLMCDVDLAGLGDSKQVYDTNAKNVRCEYSHVPIHLYAAARLELLTKLVERKSIFHLKYFHSKYERQARKNIYAEIKQLTKDAAAVDTVSVA